MKRKIKQWMTGLLVIICCFAFAPGMSEEARQIPESIVLGEDMETLFTQAMEGLLGVSYVPLAYLGCMPEEVHCFLCTGTVIYPGAAPAYKLVYVSALHEEEPRIVAIRDLDLAMLLETDPS
ncbi:MAG: hypothetical protein IJ229_05775 [Clostridia bacterium]|nr:hypothetical protein [Clostridia bacterium]MBR1686041.1 hypothetical protein [Clostridia bacterium]